MGENETIYNGGRREPRIRKTCCWRKQVLETAGGSEMGMVFQWELEKGRQKGEREVSPRGDKKQPPADIHGTL